MLSRSKTRYLGATTSATAHAHLHHSVAEAIRLLVVMITIDEVHLLLVGDIVTTTTAVVPHHHVMTTTAVEATAHHLEVDHLVAHQSKTHIHRVAATVVIPIHTEHLLLDVGDMKTGTHQMGTIVGHGGLHRLQEGMVADMMTVRLGVTGEYSFLPLSMSLKPL